LPAIAGWSTGLGGRISPTSPPYTPRSVATTGGYVEAYNIELKDDERFVGDRANKGAFRRFIDEWRKPLHAIGEDPFGDISSDTLPKKKLDALLTGGDPEAAGIVQGVIESFANGPWSFAAYGKRLRLPAIAAVQAAAWNYCARCSSHGQSSALVTGIPHRYLSTPR
jgi:hypothetical protein